MLSERLQELVLIGAVTRAEGTHGPEYELTEAGQELFALVEVLGTWGQRWLPRRAEVEDADLEPVLVDMCRRVRFEKLPREPTIVRFEISGNPVRFMLLKATESSICTHNPGFPEPLRVRGPLAALIAWWRGDAGFIEAERLGLSIDGPRVVARAFPDWFDRYLFADVRPASSGIDGSQP
jgi:hypothetical protein